MFNQREIIGEYEIQKDRLIGQGNYGKVYHCIQINKNPSQTQLNLCAKLTDVADNQNIQKYQQREYQILQIIQSNQKNFNFNLVQIYHVQYLEGQKKLFVVMEKCDCSLQNILDYKKVFTEDDIIDFMNQFAKGYQGLYENNIVHRDLKPENILLKKNFQGKYIYKIADFGVGKIYKQNDFDNTLTKVGTPMYSAPEQHIHYDDNELKYIISQMRQKKCVIDMYSFGIILYQMIYQNFPYNRQLVDIIQFLQNIKKQPIRVPRIPNFRQQIFEIIDGLLIYNPQQRLNFEQFSQRIKEIGRITLPQQQFQFFQPNEYFQEVKQYLTRMLLMNQSFFTQQSKPYIENFINQQQWNQNCEWIFTCFVFQKQNNHIYKDDDLSFLVSLKCLQFKKPFKDRNNRNLMLHFLEN